nr:hypothetical protein [Bacillus pumilus]
MIMNQGKVCQFDTPREIATHPADDFVYSLIQSSKEQERFWGNLT